MKTFFRSNRRRLALFFADVMCIIFVSIISCFLLLAIREISYEQLNIHMYTSIGVFALLSVLFMNFFGCYRVLWRYAQIKEYVRCFAAVTVAMVLFMVTYLFKSSATPLNISPLQSAGQIPVLPLHGRQDPWLCVLPGKVP